MWDMALLKIRPSRLFCIDVFPELTQIDAFVPFHSSRVWNLQAVYIPGAVPH